MEQGKNGPYRTVKLHYNVLGYNVPSVITDVIYGPRASECPAYSVLYNGLTG